MLQRVCPEKIPTLRLHWHLQTMHSRFELVTLQRPRKTEHLGPQAALLASSSPVCLCEVVCTVGIEARFLGILQLPSDNDGASIPARVRPLWCQSLRAGAN